MKTRVSSLLSLALCACMAMASSAALAAPAKRIVSTTPSVTGILLAMDAPLLASAAATPTRLTDAKGFFTQWADIADQRGVQVLYKSLLFDIEAVIAQDPDLVVISTTGADSVVQHQAELQAQGLNTVAVNYSNQSWQEMAVALGQATGLQDKAQAAIQRFDAYVAQTAASIKPPAGSVSVVGYNIGASYSITQPTSPHAQMLSALGFKVVGLPKELDSQVKRVSDFAFISQENLSAAISGDSVFLMSASDADVQAFLADPLLANLPAVINKRVYALGPSSFRIDYYSGREMIDTVARSFR